MGTHGRLITHRTGFDAWKPRCRCGWQGPLEQSRDEAVRAYEQHASDPHRDDAGWRRRFHGS